MAIETDIERAIFLSADDFGVSATYVKDKRYGTEATISGLFDNEHYAVDTGGSVPVTMQQPVFVCLTSAVSGIEQNDILTISSTQYRVRDIRPDGQGMTTLALEEQ